MLHVCFLFSKELGKLSAVMPYLENRLQTWPKNNLYSLGNQSTGRSRDSISQFAGYHCQSRERYSQFLLAKTVSQNEFTFNARKVHLSLHCRHFFLTHHHQHHYNSKEMDAIEKVRILLSVVYYKLR